MKMDFAMLRQMTCDARDATECWRYAARRWRDLYDGNHWTQRERDDAKERELNLLTFNRVPLLVDGITGLEVNNRKEISYQAMPPAYALQSQQPVDMQQLGMLTDGMNATSEHFRCEADSEDAESAAFRDMIVTGLGATETYIDYDRDPRGNMKDERVDFEELLFDAQACQRNLEDGCYVGRVRDLPAKEAERMFPDKHAHDIDACWIEAGKEPDEEYYNTPLERVTLVHLQWREFEDVWRIRQTGREIDNDLAESIRKAGREELIKKVGERAVWKQAYLGAREILNGVEYAPSKHRPSITIMGYERDHSDNGTLWYGLLKRVEGPQYAANKFLTKLVEASDHSGGGYFIEEDATDDIASLEKDLTDSGRLKVLNKNAIQQGKISPVQVSNPPLAAADLMTFSVSSIRDVTGLNLEMFGLADRDQAGVVENARKQSAYTTLAPIFDRLKSYRKEKGRLQKDYIFSYLRDGRIIRKNDGSKTGFFPLTYETLPDAVEYDVKVDEQSTSPDNKARTLATLPVLQAMFGGQLPPQIATMFIPYLDLPARLITEMMEVVNEPNPQAQQAAQMQQQMIQLETAKTQSEIEENKASTLHEIAQAQSEWAQGQKWLAEAGHKQQQAFNESIAPQFKAMEALGGIFNGR